MDERLCGGCLCGAVRFEGTGARDIGACHCRMCRRVASGPFLATRFASGVTVTEGRGLKWWQSSDHGERGFCGDCGATLFWRARGCAEGAWAVSAGALDTDPDLTIFEHIYSDRKPGYYEFADSAPRITEAQIIGKSGKTEDSA